MIKKETLSTTSFWIWPGLKARLLAAVSAKREVWYEKCLCHCFFWVTNTITAVLWGCFKVYISLGKYSLKIQKFNSKHTCFSDRSQNRKLLEVFLVLDWIWWTCLGWLPLPPLSPSWLWPILWLSFPLWWSCSSWLTDCWRWPCCWSCCWSCCWLELLLFGAESKADAACCADKILWKLCWPCSDIW